MIRAAFAVLLLLFSASACSRAKPQAAVAPSPAPVTARVAANATTPSGPSLAPPPATPGAVTPGSVDLEPEPPHADLYDLARRYRSLSVSGPPPTQPPPAQVGDTHDFFVYNIESTNVLTISASLIVQTEHADFWLQSGQNISRTEMERGARDFEEKVYPTVTADFGLPAPAPDGRPGRVSVLHFNLKGAGGYFAAGDQLPRALNRYSNEQQIVYLQITAAKPGDPGYAGLLAHEFQHLVHQQRNPVAETWINEGLSEVADELLGGGNQLLRSFDAEPDTQLDAWPAGDRTSVHYGAGHSFLRYLLRRYGGVERAKDLSAEWASGVNSVERYLRANFGAGFLDLFADWTVANLLRRPGDERYSQSGVDHATLPVEKLPSEGSGDGQVRQFGADYLQFQPNGRDINLSFQGSDRVQPVPVSPVSGRAFWWSNRADSMDSTLTRELDLRAVKSATLRYKLWFNIEKDYDFGYVALSRDGGASWQALRGNQTTDRDPLAVAYGPAYSGRSNGWIDESVDLSPFAGERVLVRFEYVTDEAAEADGMALNDLSVPEIGWSDDAEAENGWQSSGFLRISEPLPQRYILQLVEEDDRGAVSVNRVEAAADGRAQIRIAAADRRATLVVSGATFGTTEAANYHWEARR